MIVLERPFCSVDRPAHGKGQAEVGRLPSGATWPCGRPQRWPSQSSSSSGCLQPATSPPGIKQAYLVWKFQYETIKKVVVYVYIM